MKFLHCMIRVKNLEESLDFYCNKLRLKLLRHKDYSHGRFSLYFLATDEGAPEIELTHNWDEQIYIQGNNFGHLAYLVDDIYETCQHLQANGVQILRPPRDGRMAFIKDPNGISIELLQAGQSLSPAEPWVSMPNVGTW
ncbi:VOC family protein [Scytonema sp. PRP1]|uniref:VOC family protein n=1 Tax=Scytonema sp. PRP1 TaxID=3120513 RepID=UPI002FD6DF4A